MSNRSVARTFAEAILANHQHSDEMNVELWRVGAVMLAQCYLELVDGQAQLPPPPKTPPVRIIKEGDTKKG